MERATGCIQRIEKRHLERMTAILSSEMRMALQYKTGEMSLSWPDFVLQTSLKRTINNSPRPAPPSYLARLFASSIVFHVAKLHAETLVGLYTAKMPKQHMRSPFRHIPTQLPQQKSTTTVTSGTCIEEQRLQWEMRPTMIKDKHNAPKGAQLANDNYSYQYQKKEVQEKFTLERQMDDSIGTSYTEDEPPWLEAIVTGFYRRLW